MASVLILSSSELQKDPRVLRQIEALKNVHNVLACGLTPSNISGVKDIPILLTQSKSQPFILRAFNYLKFRFNQFDKMTWNDSIARKLSNYSYEVIVVNDPREMPLALKLKKLKNNKPKIYLDLHEYFIDVDTNPLVNNMFNYLSDNYTALADYRTTVNKLIAKLYGERYGIEEPEVITNAGPLYSILPSSTVDNKIRMVHHGSLNRSRKLELMIDLFEGISNNFYLTFYLNGTDQEYLKFLKNRAKKHSRIMFKPAVAFDKIVETLNQYDIGLYILPLTNRNNELALPNKLFEFIQARLAIAISPNEAMAEIVLQYANGIISENFEISSMAEILNRLTIDDIKLMKIKSDLAASIENDAIGKEKIRTIINRLG